MSSKKRYDKNGDHPYKKHIKDLIRFLKEKNAVVQVLDRKYGKGQENSINDLIKTACKLDNVYEFTRSEKPVKSTLSRLNAVRDLQMSVIDKVKFYFIGEKPGEKEGKTKYDQNLQKGDIYIKKEESPFKYGAHVLDIYSELAANINSTVVERLSNLDKTKLYLRLLKNSSSLPFNVLHKKVSQYLSQSDSDHLGIEEELQNLAEGYKEAYQRESKEINNRFNRQLLVGSSNFSILSPGSQKLEEKEREETAAEVDLFGKGRYKSVKQIEGSLKETPINQWPKGVLKQVILAYMEYLAVHEYLTSIVREEVEKYVRLRVFYRKFDVDDLFVDDLDITIQEFSKVLRNYNIDSNLEALTNFESGNVITNSIKELPVPEFNDHYIQWKEIDRHITVEFRLHLFEKLAYHTGLKNPDMQFVYGELSDYWPET